MIRLYLIAAVVLIPVTFVILAARDYAARKRRGE
jgi:hypothetical protein